MSQLEKLIEKMRQSKTDVRFTDLEQILIHSGYARIRQKGSHVHFRKQDAPLITIPIHKNKVKSVYTKEIIKLLGI